MEGWKYKPHNWADSVLGDIIGDKESRNDYSAYNKISNGQVSSYYNTNLASLKIVEIMNMQAQGSILAAGRFQLIGGTLKQAIKFLSITPSSLFDRHVQDKIFNEYIIHKKRPAVKEYLEGTGKIEDAMHQLAKEFASIGVEKGQPISRGRIAKGGESYYSEDGFNKSLISPKEIREALENSKKEF